MPNVDYGNYLVLQTEWRDAFRALAAMADNDRADELKALAGDANSRIRKAASTPVLVFGDECQIM